MALQGSLDTFALPDVLRLLATTAKTGRLRIDGDRGHGSVWLRDGTVMSAMADGAIDDAPAEEVLFELLRFEEGAFAFDMDELSPNGEQPEDVEILLRNAGALLSEWNELVAIVPSLEHRVDLVQALPGGDVTVDSRRWPSLVAVASGRTVRDVASTLGLSELGATRAVRDLVDLGIAQVSEPSGEDTIPPANRNEVPPEELARRSPFSGLGSGESLATSVPRADTDGLPRVEWFQAAEPSGEHGAIPDPLMPTGSGGRGQDTPGNGAGPPTPPAGSEVPPRRGRSAAASTPGASAEGGPTAGSSSPSGASGSAGPGKRATSGPGRSAPSGRPSGSRAPGRSPSSRPGSGRSSGAGKRAGRGTTGTGSSGGGRDASGDTRRPSTPGATGRGPANGDARRPPSIPGAAGSGPATGDARRPPSAMGPTGQGPANGDASSRPGKMRPPSTPRRPGGPGRPPILPDTGPLSTPPVSPGAFEAGPLGPSPLPPDTGQIRPVSPSALPPDLQWAVDDEGSVPPPGPFGNGLGNGVANGNGVGPRGNGAPLGGAPMAGTGAPLDPRDIAPHVAAMSPEARAAVQGTVGNTGGAANGLGPGDELAQRGQLLNFLSSVRP